MLAQLQGVLEHDFHDYVRGIITEQEWIRREALAVMEVVAQLSSSTQVTSA